MAKYLGVLPPTKEGTPGTYLVVDAQGVAEADKLATKILSLPLGQNTGISWRDISTRQSNEWNRIFRI